MPLIYACIASHVGDLIDEANSLGPTLVLRCASKGNPVKPRLLSYEVNVYFGIMCAEFDE